MLLRAVLKPLLLVIFWFAFPFLALLTRPDAGPVLLCYLLMLAPAFLVISGAALKLSIRHLLIPLICLHLLRPLQPLLLGAESSLLLSIPFSIPVLIGFLILWPGEIDVLFVVLFLFDLLAFLCALLTVGRGERLRWILALFLLV